MSLTHENQFGMRIETTCLFIQQENLVVRQKPWENSIENIYFEPIMFWFFVRY